jgi:O-acetyl-ADP-ribose deacetylase (regulator of RNase III)
MHKDMNNKKTLFLVVMAGISLSIGMSSCEGCVANGGAATARGAGAQKLVGENKISWEAKWKSINTHNNILQAQGWINTKDKSKINEWLSKVGIKDKNIRESVVVNAANDHIASPGGGIDGALGKWAEINGTTPWTKPVAILGQPSAVTLPDGSKAPSTLEAGKFALFPVSFGDIYLAVGPIASGVKTLEKTKTLVADLYYNILTKAQQDGRKNVVLCAISTAIFAGAGQETETGVSFTKEQFIDSVYEGMYEGIKRFQSQNTSKLSIVLNNWDNKVIGSLAPCI